jgi:hypothetical protein
VVVQWRDTSGTVAGHWWYSNGTLVVQWRDSGGTVMGHRGTVAGLVEQ